MSEHLVTPRAYLIVFALLIALTIATVAMSFAEIEPWHLVFGLAIGTCKAMLVVLFFMHVLYSSRLTWAVIGGSLVWLLILLGLTMSDYLTRGWLAY